MKPNHEQSFLGTGWNFPVAFDKRNATTRMLEGVADIESSIAIILSTMPGERVMQPSFGCNLQPYVFEVMNPPILAMMEKIIREALIYHEPRMIVESVSSEAFIEEGRVEFSISYQVITTNTRYNYVYPFYINEATNKVR